MVKQTRHVVFRRLRGLRVILPAGLALALLFLAGISGCVIILANVVKAYRQRRRIQHRLMEARAAA